MVNEKKIVASNYIINFYKDVAALTDSYSKYQNDLIFLKTKNKTLTDTEIQKSISEEEKQIILNNVTNIRYWILKVYVELQSIKDKIKIDKENIEKIEAKYKEIKEQFIIDADLAEEFVTLFNKIIVNSVIVSLLRTSESLLDEVYNG